MKLFAKIFAAAVVLTFCVTSYAQEKLKLNFPNEDITKIIEYYAKASGQKFIVDATVRGRIALLNPTDVTLEEAYNQLSTALALNGFAILKQGDTFVVRNARSAQRDLIEVTNELPKMNPPRMITWIITLKYMSAGDANREIRTLTSSYGEMSTVERLNQLMITDWSTNMQRIAEVIKRLDVPADSATTKIVNQAKKERLERMAKQEKEPKAKPHFVPSPPPADENSTN